MFSPWPHSPPSGVHAWMCSRTHKHAHICKDIPDVCQLTNNATILTPTRHLRLFYKLCSHLSVCPDLRLSVCQSLAFCLSVCVPVCLSVRLSLCLSLFVSPPLSICLSVCLSAGRSVYLPLSVCLSVYMSTVCLSPRQDRGKASRAEGPPGQGGPQAQGPNGGGQPGPRRPPLPGGGGRRG